MSLSGAAAQVAVDLIADAKDVSRSINATIREVSLLGQAIDTTNDIAVQTWKKAADAAREYLTVSKATHEQQLKLEVAISRTDDRIKSQSVATVAGTKNMGFFSAMVAEASGHLGEHSLSLGRVERGLSSFAEHTLGVNSTLGLLVTSLGKFAIGSIEITAILAGIDAVVGIYDLFTSSSREAEKAQDDLLKKMREVEAQRLAGGVEGQTVGAAQAEVASAKAALANPFSQGSTNTLKANLTKANDDLAVAIANRDALYTKSTESQDRTFTSDLASLITHHQATHEQRLIGLALLKADQEALDKLPKWDVSGRAGMGSEIDKLHSALFPKEKQQKGLEGAELAQLHEAVRMGSAAIAALDRRMKDDEKARRDLDVLNVRTLETKASAMDVASPAGALSQLAVIEAKREVRRKEIDEMNISNDLKAALQKQADDEEVAAVQALNRRISAENKRFDAEQLTQKEKDAKKEADVIKKRADLIYSVETNMSNALIHSRKDLGRQLLRAALDPEVKLLEGLAAKQFALAAGDFADLNFAGGARHLEAGAVFATEAGVVAGIAGGGGGGGAGSGGGGGGGPAGAQLGAGARAGESDQITKFEFVLIHQDQSGREIARTRQQIDRATNLNQPIRVAL
ncbi:MAG: hypothetical protein ACJ8AK_03010 [Gemmatimonadaceae bacterium]